MPCSLNQMMLFDFSVLLHLVLIVALSYNVDGIPQMHSKREEDRNVLEFGSSNIYGIMKALSAISEKSVLSDLNNNVTASNNELESVLQELESKVNEVSRNENQNHLKTVEGSRVVEQSLGLESVSIDSLKTRLLQLKNEIMSGNGRTGTSKDDHNDTKERNASCSNCHRAELKTIHEEIKEIRSLLTKSSTKSNLGTKTTLPGKLNDKLAVKNNTSNNKTILPFNSTYEPNTEARQRAFNQIKLIPIVDYKSGYKSGKLKPKSSKNEIIENTENNDISLGLEEGLVISKATDTTMQIKAQKSSDVNASPKLHRRQFQKSMFVVPKRQRNNENQNIVSNKFKETNVISEEKTDVKIHTKPLAELGMIGNQKIGIDNFRKENETIKDPNKSDQKRQSYERQKVKDEISLFDQIHRNSYSDINSNHKSKVNNKQQSRRDIKNSIRSQNTISKSSDEKNGKHMQNSKEILPACNSTIDGSVRRTLNSNTFQLFEVCEEGLWKTRTCKHGSLFWAVHLCCIPIISLPSSKYCDKVYR